MENLRVLFDTLCCLCCGCCKRKIAATEPQHKQEPTSSGENTSVWSAESEAQPVQGSTNVDIEL